MASTTTGDTINGSFGTLDFTNLPYSQITADSYNPTSGVLTVTAGSEYESITLVNPGETSFSTESDGVHGTDIAGVGTSTIAINSVPVGATGSTSPSAGDNLVQLSFNNDKLIGGANYALTGTLSGSPIVDYTNNTVSGSLSFTSNGQTQTFTQLSYLPGPAGGDFLTLGGSNGTNEVVLEYSTQQPTNVLASVEVQDPTTGANDSFNGSAAVTVTPLCFASRTRIRTTNGDCAVERLAVGDLAVTASGAVRPIRWIGHRAVRCAEASVPSDLWPVRIRAGAFGADLPDRDLYLSPGHPVLVDGDAGEVLVPIMCLINGTTIERTPRDEVTYWHVELDGHDILLAEGLPAESFHDGGSRSWFVESATDPLANPDLVPAGRSARCRQVAIDGPVVEAERRRLDGLFATALVRAAGWPVAHAAESWL